MTQEVIGNSTYNYTYDTYGNIHSKTTTSGATANFTYGTSFAARGRPKVAPTLNISRAEASKPI